MNDEQRQVLHDTIDSDPDVAVLFARKGTGVAVETIGEVSPDGALGSILFALSRRSDVSAREMSDRALKIAHQIEASGDPVGVAYETGEDGDD